MIQERPGAAEKESAGACVLARAIHLAEAGDDKSGRTDMASRPPSCDNQERGGAIGGVGW